MDDMIITGNDKNGIVQLKNLRNATFKMKDLGKLTNFFGVGGWIFVGWYHAKPKEVCRGSCYKNMSKWWEGRSQTYGYQCGVTSQLSSL